MTHRRLFIVIAAHGLICLLAFGQQNVIATGSMQRVSRVQELVRLLRIATKEDAKRYTPGFRDDITAQINQLIVEQTSEILNRATEPLPAVKQALRDMHLSRDVPDEYSGGPYVFREMLNGTPLVTIAYELRRGGSGASETKVRIQAYRQSATGWQLVAETGDDLDHHGLFLMQVPSPRAGEVWLLAYGGLTGFNGRKIRMRMYGFNGEKFSTIWSPRDRLDATVALEGPTIILRYIDEEHYYKLRVPPYHRVDRLALTLQGVEELTSSLDQQ
jgi:hypothetical protein